MTQTLDLAGIADYPADWKHQDKRIYPGEHLVLPGAVLKWYDVRRADQEATPEVSEQARAYLLGLAEAGTLEFRGELGWVLLHRDGEKYFMIVAVWRDKNELWTGIHQLGADGFEVYPPKQGLLRPTMDILELDCTSHERRGWSRYLTSDRDTAAKQAYLDDACTGQLV